MTKKKVPDLCQASNKNLHPYTHTSEIKSLLFYWIFLTFHLSFFFWSSESVENISCVLQHICRCPLWNCGGATRLAGGEESFFPFFREKVLAFVMKLKWDPLEPSKWRTLEPLLFTHLACIIIHRFSNDSSSILGKKVSAFVYREQSRRYSSKIFKAPLSRSLSFTGAACKHPRKIDSAAKCEYPQPWSGSTTTESCRYKLRWARFC